MKTEHTHILHPRFFQFKIFLVPLSLTVSGIKIIETHLFLCVYVLKRMKCAQPQLRKYRIQIKNTLLRIKGKNKSDVQQASIDKRTESNSAICIEFPLNKQYFLLILDSNSDFFLSRAVIFISPGQRSGLNDTKFANKLFFIQVLMPLNCT